MGYSCWQRECCIEISSPVDSSLVIRCSISQGGRRRSKEGGAVTIGLLLFVVIILAVLVATSIAYRTAIKVKQTGKRARCADCSATWYYSHPDATKNRKRTRLTRELLTLGEMMIHHSHLFSITEKGYGLSRCPKCGSSNIRVEDSNGGEA